MQRCGTRQKHSCLSVTDTRPCAETQPGSGTGSSHSVPVSTDSELELTCIASESTGQTVDNKSRNSPWSKSSTADSGWSLRDSDSWRSASNYNTACMLAVCMKNRPCIRQTPPGVGLPLTLLVVFRTTDDGTFLRGTETLWQYLGQRQEN